MTDNGQPMETSGRRWKTVMVDGNQWQMMDSQWKPVMDDGQQ